MHIMGMLKLMTWPSRQVVSSCGTYCTQASTAAPAPNATAQEPKADGAQRRRAAEVTRSAIQWAPQMMTTARAVRHVGGGGASGGWSGPRVGKKMRKRIILGPG